MRPTDAAAADGSDAWLDELLVVDAREHRAGYVGDEGFTAKVMSRLPAPVELPAWRTPALVALWLVALASIGPALPDVALDVLHQAYRFVAGQPLSLSGIAAGIAAAGALSWAAAAWTMKEQ